MTNLIKTNSVIVKFYSSKELHLLLRVNKDQEHYSKQKEMSAMGHKTQNDHFIILSPISYYYHLLFLTSLYFMDPFQ